jgi:hypothetical protein
MADLITGDIRIMGRLLMSKIRGKYFLIIFGYFSLALWQISAAPKTLEQKVDWTNIKKQFDIYLDYPSTENAYRFYESLPKLDFRAPSEMGSQVIRYIFDNFEKVEKQIWASDRNAVKVAIRLYNISDGWYAETIDSALGEFIRINPKLFLEELKNHLSLGRFSDGDFPVLQGNMSIYSKRDVTYQYELEMRIKALKSVKDKALVSVRDRCVEQIRDYIERKK